LHTLPPVRIDAPDYIAVELAKGNEILRVPRHIGIEKNQIRAVVQKKILDRRVARIVYMAVARKQEIGTTTPASGWGARWLWRDPKSRPCLSNFAPRASRPGRRRKGE